ncbi:ankyrin repeat, SAM and basic leucine zipper domain-containing protein 1 isoform X1 [Gasterosteus aculeatus]|uniref:ankyrin repeat, SAM and basic leucine zipper domain-containing protein 1-like isoform X1 n=1 Tax=Gasterosteus aculeatus aculeatus TaxID=481459 RepID=UPI001A97F1B7|nr:ankyrin repeat, SAM and basic leucine zipper domain-containing protein 1-like isoform X1 [Gasterosteus aculeatus aculeatus]
MDNAYPAGAESDGSNDEWDVGRLDTTSFHATDVGDAVAQDTLMKRAIDKGDIGTVQQLLDNGLDVETRLRFEWTPLMCAVSVANYDLAKLLLDRGASANFSKDHWTVLMASCTASATEDQTARCVELLLSRSADPNMVDRSQMTCLMLAARDGHSKVINLLVSHGAAINVQDANGYTALCIAVQYDREEAVLQLLQLGADKTIRTKAGKSPTDVAVRFKHTQVIRILASSSHSSAPRAFFSTEETLSRFFMTNSAPPPSNESVTKLDDLELLMHGLGLGHLTDIIAENDITWSRLLTMEEEDLQKVGVTDPEDQQKLLSAVQQMHLDHVDLGSISLPSPADSGSLVSCRSEELYNFLISRRHQCCYLTEAIQDVIRQFPRHASQLVFSPDPKREALAACNLLVVQTKDLQKEVTCLRNLLCQADETADPCLPPRPASRGNRRFRLTVSGVALSALGAASLLLYRAGRGGAVQRFPWWG